MEGFSRYGLVAFGSSLDQIGPLSNFAEDIALVMEVIGRNDAHDSTSLPVTEKITRLSLSREKKWECLGNF